MGKKKMVILGLIIEVPKGNPKIATHDDLAQRGKPRELRFKFKVAEGSPANPLFYSSPRLREILANFPVLKGKYIGGISFSGFTKYKKGEMIVYQDIYPFGYHRKAEKLMGKGIATELERKVLTEMRKRFGNKIVIEAEMSIATKLRAKQMGKWGVKAGIGYKEPINRLISGINMARRQERKKRRVRRR